jgi:hypothetical protein
VTDTNEGASEASSTKAAAQALHAGGGAGELDAIYVLDELLLRPGRLADFLEAMERDYRPAAEARGQRLVHTWVTPPTSVEGPETTLLLVWRLEGIPGFWGMRSRNAEPDVRQWWQDCESFVLRRTRRFAASPGAVEGFEAAGRANA